MSKLEEAARALYVLDTDERWDLLHADHKKLYLDGVSAVLRAIREPDEAMLNVCGNGECAKWAPGAWKAMIDALLDEPPQEGR